MANVTLKALHNTGDPLTAPDGTVMAGATVSFQLVLLATKKAIDMFDATTGELVSAEPVEATTDISGEFVTALWPNNRGISATCYKVMVDTEYIKPFYIVVDESISETTLLAAKTAFDAGTGAVSMYLVPTPSINDAVASASTSATAAAGSALDASTSATAAAGSALDASTSATAAAAAVSSHESAYNHTDIAHANRAALDLVSGTNTGDQDLSGLALKTTTVNGHALSANVVVTASDVGLGNVNNTSDLDKPVSTAVSAALSAKADLVAGVVPANQLPSYVDDVLEYANLAAFPASGEAGKIYVALDTNKTYRWSGSAYIYITSGAVDSVAGKTGVVVLAKADVGLGNVDNTSDIDKPVSAAQATAINAKMASPMSAAGDLIVGGASGAPTRLPPGAEGQVLGIVSGVPGWNDVAGTSPDTMNALTAVVMQAVAESGLALREVMKTINQRFQTGQATIRNTGVVSGCNVTAGGTGRLVNLSSGIIYLNAQRRGVVAQTSTASIAQNTGTETGYVYLYLDNTGDLKATNLNEAAPANTLLLYTVTVPAGNTAEDLTGCTLTKTATTQADYPLFVSALPYVSVTLPYNMDDANYLVDLELVSLSGASQQLGCLTISNKTTTGFRINLNGTADNVVVNWTARKMTL